MWCEGIECVTVVKMHKYIIVSISASLWKKVAQTRYNMAATVAFHRLVVHTLYPHNYKG